MTRSHIQVDLFKTVKFFSLSPSLSLKTKKINVRNISPTVIWRGFKSLEKYALSFLIFSWLEYVKSVNQSK